MNNRAVLLAAGLLAGGVWIMTGEETAPSVTFTPAQAEAGRAAYENTCGKCHTPTLMGRKGEPGELPPIRSLSAYYQEFIGPRGFVSPLAGQTFIERWGSKTTGQLIARFQETADAFLPKGTDPETTVNITAYVLQVNGAKAGNRPLTRTTDVIVRSITRWGNR